MPVSPAHLEKLIAQVSMGLRMEDIMREDERKAGHLVVLPGDVTWLPAEDWDPTIVVSVDGAVVRLVALLARRPGNGAFGRLIYSINDAGLTPCVIAPTIEMRTTLKRWGWKGRHHGHGWNSEERWKPRRNG